VTPARKSDQARQLLGRVRTSLPKQRMREVRMVGAIAIMVDDAMAVAVHKDGSLLVRVDPAEDARCLRSLARPARRWGQDARWAKGGSE
jgi:hypothetical protein